MDRRRFVAALPVLATGPYLGATLGLSLSACGGEPLTGPVEIKWDRDVCARCSMVISERAYAAQIRDPMKKVFKFDDFGCAVFWKEHQTFSDAEIEFWAVDSAEESAGNSARNAGKPKWLDARKASYMGGRRTPMGYGFAAVGNASSSAVSYPEAMKQILAKGK